MSTDLASLLAGGPVTIKPRRCKFATTLAGMTDVERSAVLDALHGTEWVDAKLARLLEQGGRGHHAPSSLSRHRTGDCVCTEFTDAAAVFKALDDTIEGLTA